MQTKTYLKFAKILSLISIIFLVGQSIGVVSAQVVAVNFGISNITTSINGKYLYASYYTNNQSGMINGSGLMIENAQTGSILSKIPMEFRSNISTGYSTTPTTILIPSPSGEYLYIIDDWYQYPSNYSLPCNFALQKCAPFNMSMITTIDLSTNKIISQSQYPYFISSPAINPSGTIIYAIKNEGQVKQPFTWNFFNSSASNRKSISSDGSAYNNSIIMINTKTDNPIGNINENQEYPDHLVINSAGTYLYVISSNYAYENYSINSSTGEPIGNTPNNIYVTAYYSNNTEGIFQVQNNTIMVISTQTDKPVKKIPIYTEDIAANPSNPEIYVLANSILIINTTMNNITGSIPYSSYPYSIGFDKTGSLAYLTIYNDSDCNGASDCMPGSDVLFINTKTQKVTNETSTGPGVQALAINPLGTLLYVVNYGYNETINKIPSGQNIPDNETVNKIPSGQNIPEINNISISLIAVVVIILILLIIAFIYAKHRKNPIKPSL